MNTVEIKNIKEKYNLLSKDNQNVAQECRVIDRILAEFEWKNLPDQEKQIIRKNDLKSILKIAQAEEDYKIYNLKKSIVDLYEIIELLIVSINDLNKENENCEYIFRLKAMVEIEKLFINEHYQVQQLRHNDYYIIQNLLKEIKENNEMLYKQLELENFKKSFHQMYILWERRPYKEIC